MRQRSWGCGRRHDGNRGTLWERQEGPWQPPAADSRTQHGTSSPRPESARPERGILGLVRHPQHELPGHLVDIAIGDGVAPAARLFLDHGQERRCEEAAVARVLGHLVVTAAAEGEVALFPWPLP